MLQPMHSRMSSSRPSSILRGRNGSAIEGRAAPMKSSTPLRMSADHAVRRGVPADADHRLARQRLDEGDERLLVALLFEACCRAVVLPTADIDIPEIGELSEHRDDFAALRLAGEASGADQLVYSKPDGDRAGVADCVFGILDQLAEKTSSVLKAAAVLVTSVIVATRQEVHREGKVVAGIDVDEVKTGLACVYHSAAVPDAICANILLIHGAG